MRNLLSGSKHTDFDFTTDAKPGDVQRMFNRVIPTGIKHGTVTVLHRGEKFEVTTFRVDGQYTDQRHPDTVSYTSSLTEDLRRRDFTINAIVLDPIRGEYIDPHNGRADLKAQIIRAIGNPVERFSEDALRLMRACRFAATLNFEIEQDTLLAMKTTANLIAGISAERIRTELEKMLSASLPSKGLQLMDSTRILDSVLPELTVCKRIEQKRFHDFDVFLHSLYSCDGAPQDDLTVRIAALFHDIGKPMALEEDEAGLPTFYRHEVLSAELARKIMRRLTFSKKIENDVYHLIFHHMFNYEDTWSDSAVRRFIVRVGLEYIPRLYALRHADIYGMRCIRRPSGMCQELADRISAVIKKDTALTARDLVVNGRDLHSFLGIPKGPIMGRTIEYLLEAVLDDPMLNTREHLLSIADKFYRRYG